jgi:hypothetical protein
MITENVDIKLTGRFPFPTIETPNLESAREPPNKTSHDGAKKLRNLQHQTHVHL